MKKPSEKQRQAAFLKADIQTQVCLAAPLARSLVMLGLSDVEGVCNPSNMDLPFHIEELIGHDGPSCDDKEFPRLGESQQAAFALGIAVGLLLRPDAFTGGAK
jgi:hypothetical protein